MKIDYAFQFILLLSSALDLKKNYQTRNLKNEVIVKISKLMALGRCPS